MIYSYIEVEHLDPPVYVSTFDVSQIVKRWNDKVKNDESAMSPESLSNMCIHLGKVDDRWYVSVPDDVEIGEQPEECDVRKENNLSHDILLQLVNHGDYANSQRQLASLDIVPRKDSISQANALNFADIYTEIRALTSVVAKLAEATPAVLDSNVLDTEVIFGLNLLNKYNKTNNTLNDKFVNVGL